MFTCARIRIVLLSSPDGEKREGERASLLAAQPAASWHSRNQKAMVGIASCHEQRMDARCGPESSPFLRTY